MLRVSEVTGRHSRVRVTLPVQHRSWEGELGPHQVRTLFVSDDPQWSGTSTSQSPYWVSNRCRHQHRKMLDKREVADVRKPRAVPVSTGTAGFPPVPDESRSYEK